MAASPTYPGVYIQELPSAVHPITGVATSIAAFVGYTASGIDDFAQQIFSFSDYSRLYGGLASNSELSYAVQQFFANGGTQAYVVRTSGPSAAEATVVFSGLTFTARSKGAWANDNLLIDVDLNGLASSADTTAFNLTITNLVDGTVESFPNVSLKNTRYNYIANVVNDPDSGSQLVTVAVSSTADTPTATGIIGSTVNVATLTTTIAGASGTTATAEYGIQLTTSHPTPSPLGTGGLYVKVFAKGAQVPQTVAGLAGQLQKAINTALAAALPGASVLCAASPSTGASQAIRINAFLPQAPDAVLTVGTPATPPLDASGVLGLTALTTTNAAHYALGSANTFGLEQVTGHAGADGTTLPGTTELLGDQGLMTGIYALAKVTIFNILCIPDATRALAGNPNSIDSSATLEPNDVFGPAITFCDSMNAFLLIDCPPEVNTLSTAVDWKTSGLTVTDPKGCGAAFFPRLRLPDPLNSYQLRTFAPCGVVAGLYARIDSTRGVYKSPAGTEATLTGVQSLVYKLSDAEQGVLNPLGLNCFRTFPVYGSILWGARTIAGADAETSQWKYVAVRRVALFLESSLQRATQWIVFEPNDEPLWSAIRLNIGSFMQELFMQGYFQGQTPAQAYFVKCDSETTTQTDIDNGIVNIVVGFAPLEPAEFVIIQIEQLAGQSTS